MIAAAEHYILIDFFFTDFTGVEDSAYRKLSNEVTEALIAKKNKIPEITIQFITDPINVVYDGHRSTQFEQLEAAGIPVTITELRPLRDSNPLYSSLWRTAFMWFGNSNKEGFLPNPFNQSSPDLGLRTYLKMLNFKANHRKVVLTDYTHEDQKGIATLITSANPHDGSSAHDNIAVRVDANLWEDVLLTESAVTQFSGGSFIQPEASFIEEVQHSSTGTLSARLLTEEKTKAHILDEISNTTEGDTIDILMFYIADRAVVKALKDADTRGVRIRLMFDPNKDAFGRTKNGSPNRQVAHELNMHTQGNTQIRWCDTHGEQCHSKLLLITRDGHATMLQGSANYTKRNLHDYNLETNMKLIGPTDAAIFDEMYSFFNAQWNNENDRTYSADYATYADTGVWKSIMYRVKEFTGLSHW